MAKTIYFISHPEVQIDPEIPVPQWSLSDTGRKRLQQALTHSWLQRITAIHSSSEQKALDSADIIAQHLQLNVTTHADLGENDRASTGYLAPTEFEETADAFFASPQQSIRGWERAADAQNRIYSAIVRINQTDATTGDLAIVSHGAVGTLLYCRLTNTVISRQFDQPGNGGGNYLMFNLARPSECTRWQTIDIQNGST